MVCVVRRKRRLFVYDLDLLIDHPSGKPVDRHVDPVMLFPSHIEPSEICFSRGVFSTLSDHINQQSPRPRLRRVAEGARDCFLWFLGAANRITDGGCKTGDILPTNRLAASAGRGSQSTWQRGSQSSMEHLPLLAASLGRHP